ncbi:MAG: hypothetical protein RhofKO_02210 [Rhodothermales bacterium]
MKPLSTLAALAVALGLHLLMLAPVDLRAEAHWRILKKYLQEDIEVLREEPQVLVVAHTARQDTLRIGLAPCTSCDIIGTLEERRGSNPYRVWHASQQFWNNPERPQSEWGQYFRSHFLRLLRSPEAAN